VPGYFRPGEAERAAELVGVPLAELFRTRLAVDYLVPSERDSIADLTFVLSPAREGSEPGAEVAADPRGRCTFLTANERCEIHAAKPAECRAAMHGDSHEEAHARHIGIGLEWGAAAPRAQIASLLGREPREPDPLEMLLGVIDMVLGRRS
jgi:Fe-S-cluster containining protein